MTATTEKEPEEEVDPMAGLDRGAIAEKHGISRAAVHNRIIRGWTREEIEQGFREREEGEGKSPYKSQYSEQLGGFTVEAVADHNGLSVAGVYDRLRNNRRLELPPVTSTPK